MIIFKLEYGGVLLKTSGAMLYQYENNSDELLFLIPKNLDGLDVADNTATLRFTLPNEASTTIVHTLELMDEMRGDFYQYRLAVTSDMTTYSGTARLHLSITDSDNKIVMRSSFADLYINASTNSEDFLGEEQLDHLDLLSVRVDEIDSDVEVLKNSIEASIEEINSTIKDVEESAKEYTESFVVYWGEF